MLNLRTENILADGGLDKDIFYARSDKNDVREGNFHIQNIDFLQERITEMNA